MMHDRDFVSSDYLNYFTGLLRLLHLLWKYLLNVRGRQGLGVSASLFFILILHQMF
jgi:hypothetical protein